MTNEKHATKGVMGRLAVLIVMIVTLSLVVKFLPVWEWLGNFNDYVSQMDIAGIFIFIGVYALATVLLVPGSILTIGAGFAFGLWKGFLAVSVGSTLGAALAFLAARFIARDTVEAMAQRNHKFRKIDNAIGREGAKLIFLLRLSPVIPFNLINYFYGLTAVKFWPYVLASWVGMMPGAFLYIYIGVAGKAAVITAASAEGVKHGWQYWTFMSIGLAATIIVTIWVTKIARDAVRKTEVR